MATRRNRRLRKKLHLGEFAEYGFQVKLGSSKETCMDILCNLSADVLQPRGMTFLYMDTRQVFIWNETRTTSFEDREHVVNWLDRQTELDSSVVEPLVDARYPKVMLPKDTPNNRRRTILVIAPGGKTKECSTGIGPDRYPS